MYKGYKNHLYYKDETNKGIASLPYITKCMKCRKLNTTNTTNTTNTQCCMYCGNPLPIKGSLKVL